MNLPQLDDAYKRLLWLMKRDAGSPVEPHAGQLYTDDAGILVEYDSVDHLLDALPRVARYRAPDNGEGPLFWASFYGPLSLVERLESMGADPLQTLDDALLVWFPSMRSIHRGATPLMTAASGGQVEVVRHLLARGLSVHAVALDTDRQTAGQTALYLAARDLGTAEVIRVLVAAGADPNAADRYGFTPLGQAAERGASEVLEALLEAGADLTVPSGSHSVIELAGAASDPAGMRALVAGAFGRRLTLDDVTSALVAAGIDHRVVAREPSAGHDAPRIRYTAVCGEILDEDHDPRPGTPDYFLWPARTEADQAALDLDSELERLRVGPRRFASLGEMKGLLGIAEGGVTPFAEANDGDSRVLFFTTGIGSEGTVALEAFDDTRVVVLAAADVGEAVDAFRETVGPSPRMPSKPSTSSSPPAPPPLPAQRHGVPSPDAKASGKLPGGCLVALVLLVVSIAGLARSCYLPAPDREVFAVAPGAPWKLTIPTDLTTVKGLCRFDGATAAMHVEGEETPTSVPVVCENQDTWGHRIEVTTVRVNGIPVVSGREDVTLTFRFEIPDRKEWIGREGTLEATGTLVYPFYDIDDAIVGGVTGSIRWEQRTLPYEGIWNLTFPADNEGHRAGVARSRLWNFGFVLIGILAVIFAFVGARHLPDEKEDADAEASGESTAS